MNGSGSYASMAEPLPAVWPRGRLLPPKPVSSDIGRGTPGTFDRPVRGRLIGLTTRHYLGLRGEGWISDALPPPACPRLQILRVNLRANKPSNSGDFSFELRTPSRQ